MSEDLEKCSLVICSGDMDKVMAAFIIATTAATMGAKPTCSSLSGV
jgi:peroxiredoxin family protein